MTQVRPSQWIKSSYSGASGGDCVEIALGEPSVPIRDSKRAEDGPVIEFGRPAFTVFLTGVREG
ncbi:MULTISPECIES: DUF397 domain-containing protein [unclassified Streptomyces]|uniref:DUF397 domain-containing protein n=1 Tax=unclassified Streptomyces TaxID=2593676 RepID=UPI00081D93D4|nr:MULTISPECIES: DUF397 domain-containing protein [unclassified Streptomyces]MYR26087.1 DUF397 domain-containing protein [Streptomyces sp. SID4945]SCE95195.1 protein of unknown function [Streptomyces sp. LcepLS]